MTAWRVLMKRLMTRLRYWGWFSFEVLVWIHGKKIKEITIFEQDFVLEGSLSNKKYHWICSFKIEYMYWTESRGAHWFPGMFSCFIVLSQFRAQIGSQVFTWVKCYTKFLEGSWKELVCGLRQICTFQSDTMHMYIAHSSVHPDTGNLCQIYATPNSKILFFLIFQGLKGYQRVVGRMNVQQF